MKETTTSARCRRMRGFGVVCKHHVAHKGIATACMRNTSTLGSKKIHHDEESLVRLQKCHLHPVLGSTLSVPSLCQARSLGWSLVLPLPDSSNNRALNLMASKKSSRWSIGPFGPERLSTSAQVVSRLVRSAVVAKKGVILGRNLIQACAVFFGPSDVDS